MIDKRVVEELAGRVEEMLRSSPAADIERNLRVALQGFLEQLDLATREDLEVQARLLERAQARLAALEARLAELEGRGAGRREP